MKNSMGMRLRASAVMLVLLPSLLGGLISTGYPVGVAGAQTRPAPLAGKSLEERKEEAKRLFDERRYNDVIPLLQAILAVAPSDSDASILLTFALARLGLHTQAIEQGRKAMTLAPTHTRLQILLAGLLRQQKQTRQEAIWLYQAALKREPGNLVATLGLAETARSMGDFVTALTLYHRLVNADPEEPFNHLRLAQAYSALGYIELASPYFAKVAVLDPDNREALRALAIIDDVQDRPAKAIRRYRELLELYPDDAAARVSILELERSLLEPQLARPISEIQKIPLSNYLEALQKNNPTLRERQQQLASVESRSKMRFLPSFFFSPNFGEIGDQSTRNYNFSFGWNLADMFIDNYSVTKGGLKADWMQIYNALAAEVTSLYYQRQTDVANYQQLQRRLALEPSNIQLRQSKRALKNSIIRSSERLKLITGIL